MFTGLIQALGRVASLERRGTVGAPGGCRLVIDPVEWGHRAVVGESIAVNGCCLTLADETAATGGAMAFDVVPETLRKTTLGGLNVGSRVNLEHSLRAGDLIGGHFVQGHVEGVARVVRVQQGGDWRVRIEPPGELLPAIVAKGSIAIEGVSLTVAQVHVQSNGGGQAVGGWFEVALIPTTLRLTTLGELHADGLVNLETDILARNVLHYARHYVRDYARSGPMPLRSE